MMNERLPLEQSNESVPHGSQEIRRQIEVPLAPSAESEAEWSELQERLRRTYQALEDLLSGPLTETSKDRVSELQEKLEEIHDRQHELLGRQASGEQTAIRLWFNKDPSKQ